MLVCCFFFQAEDGIRDLVRSRGLGDVYKRQFHDYKKLGADAALLKQWAAQAGWEKLINTRGPSFRKLPAEKQANLSEKKAFALMLENPSMIRRPIVESGRTLLVGFDPDEYAQKLR